MQSYRDRIINWAVEEAKRLATDSRYDLSFLLEDDRKFKTVGVPDKAHGWSGHLWFDDSGWDEKNNRPKDGATPIGVSNRDTDPPHYEPYNPNNPEHAETFRRAIEKDKGSKHQAAAPTTQATSTAPEAPPKRKPGRVMGSKGGGKGRSLFSPTRQSDPHHKGDINLGAHGELAKNVANHLLNQSGLDNTIVAKNVEEVLTAAMNAPKDPKTVALVDEFIEKYDFRYRIGNRKTGESLMLYTLSKDGKTLTGGHRTPFGRNPSNVHRRVYEILNNVTPIPVLRDEDVKHAGSVVWIRPDMTLSKYKVKTGIKGKVHFSDGNVQHIDVGNIKLERIAINQNLKDRLVKEKGFSPESKQYKIALHHIELHNEQLNAMGELMDQTTGELRAWIFDGSKKEHHQKFYSAFLKGVKHLKATDQEKQILTEGVKKIAAMRSQSPRRVRNRLNDITRMLVKVAKESKTDAAKGMPFLAEQLSMLEEMAKGHTVIVPKKSNMSVADYIVLNTKDRHAPPFVNTTIELDSVKFRLGAHGSQERKLKISILRDTVFGDGKKIKGDIHTLISPHEDDIFRKTFYAPESQQKEINAKAESILDNFQNRYDALIAYYFCNTADKDRVWERAKQQMPEVLQYIKEETKKGRRPEITLESDGNLKMKRGTEVSQFKKPGTFRNAGAWRNHYRAGYMAEALYNMTVSRQGFINKTFKDTGVESSNGGYVEGSSVNKNRRKVAFVSYRPGGDRSDGKGHLLPRNIMNTNLKTVSQKHIKWDIKDDDLGFLR